MITSAIPGFLVGTRGALWIPTLTLVAAMHGGLVGEARAAPEHDAGLFENAIAEPGQMQGLFLALQPAKAGQAGPVPRAVSLARPLAAEELPTLQASTRVLRSRSVAVDADQLARTRTAVAEARPAMLRLNLFPDVGLNAVIERTAETRSGYSLSGRIQGQPHSAVTFVADGQSLAGAVHAKQGTYAIVFRNGTVHSIREVEGDLQCGFDIPWPRAAVGGDSGSLARMQSGGDDGSEVDLLVLFTPAALDFEGGLRQMLQSIDLDVAWTNDAYAASGVNIRLNSVAAVQVDYRESSRHGHFGLTNQGEDLKRLIEPEDGFMDEAHVLRDRYGADIVHLIVQQRGGGGRGVLLRPRAEDPAAWAFSISNSLSIPGFLAHELGHVMGLLHDRYTENADKLLKGDNDYPDYTPAPYARGYVNQRALESGAPEESRWRTIMAYEWQCSDEGFRCPHVARYSDPDQRYPDGVGDPLGVPGEQPTDAVDGPADAVRSLNETRGLIAGFRQSATRCDYRLSDERREVPATGGVFSVEVDGASNCPWTATTFGDFLAVESNGMGLGAGRLSYRVNANDGPARIGYLAVGSETLSVYQSGRIAPASVCDRTPQVRDGIVLATGSSDCGAVSEFELLDVVSLDFRGGGLGELTALDAGDFSGLGSLKELELRGNRLSRVSDQAFRDLVNLKVLDLGDNDLTTVPTAIRGLSSLQRLYLFQNRIGDVPTDAFTGLPELIHLWLEDNRITTLPDGVFSDLTNLSLLFLHGNQIADVRKETLQGPLNLGVLTLDFNPLRELRDDAFTSIPRIWSLSLKETQLGTGSLRALAGLGLGHLNLTDNRIDDLSGVVFPGATMSGLKLTNNALRAIPSGIFAGFTSDACRTRKMDLDLSGNPGSPFPLSVELDRIDDANATAGPASVVVRVREGAPWPITVQVTATGGSSFTREVTIENGTVESAPFEVAGGSATQLRLTTVPEVPGSYKGIRIVLGDALELF